MKTFSQIHLPHDTGWSASTLIAATDLLVALGAWPKPAVGSKSVDAMIYQS